MGHPSAEPRIEEAEPTPRPDETSDASVPSEPVLPPRGRLVGVVGWLFPVLVATAGSAFLYSRFLAHPTRGVPGGPDGLLYAWYFASVEHSLAHWQNPLVSHAMNVPNGVNLMWNTSVFLAALVCAPLTAVVGAIPVVGLLMVASPVLSVATAFWALRRLTGAYWASALAAMLYGFGPFFVGQNGHLHLILGAPLLPVLLVLGHRLFVTQDRSPVRTGLWLGITVSAGLLVSEEVVALSAIAAAVAVVTLAVVNPSQVRSHARHAAIGVATAAGTAVVLVGIPLLVQFAGPGALHHGVLVAPQWQDVAGLVRPSGLQYYASAADIRANHHFRPNGVENTGYLGWPLIALIAAICLGFGLRRERFVYWWALTFGAVVLLSFGSSIRYYNRQVGRGPWALVANLPMVKSVITVRFSLVVTFLVALLLAWAVSRLRSTRWAYVAGLLVVTAVLVPLRPAGRYGAILPVDPPAFFSSSAVRQIPEGAAVLVLPQASRPGVAAMTMAWQIRAHLRFDLVGGYSVFDYGYRSGYYGHLPPLASALIAVSRTGTPPSAETVARTRGPSGISVVVITSHVAHRNAVIAAATELTGCRPRHVSDVDLCEIPGT